MGVPITFLDKYNPNQFEIVGSSYKWCSEGIRNSDYKDLCPYVEGKPRYKRLFIRRKHS